jgi:hypothetical protein
MKGELKMRVGNVTRVRGVLNYKFLGDLYGRSSQSEQLVYWLRVAAYECSDSYMVFISVSRICR